MSVLRSGGREPVPFTHLNVYKRQREGRGLKIKEVASGFGTELIAHGHYNNPHTTEFAVRAMDGFHLDGSLSWVWKD